MADRQPQLQPALLRLVLTKPFRRQYPTTTKKAIIAIPLSLICALFFAQPAPTKPEGVVVKAGFLTGSEYLKMTKAEKWAYAMGAVDGMHNAPIFGAPENRTKWFDDYLAGMTNEQVAAIITKFLNDNPERWHEPLNILTYEAIEHAYNKM